MNRHERRAAEVRARAAGKDKGFEALVRQARRSFSTISDRAVGEAWMRGEAWKASGAEGMTIHSIGEAPAPHQPDDIHVSLAYGDLRFKAIVPLRLLRQQIDGWVKLLDVLLAEAAKGLFLRGLDGFRIKTRSAI
jgi:hypothetical protein